MTPSAVPMPLDGAAARFRVDDGRDEHSDDAGSSGSTRPGPTVPLPSSMASRDQRGRRLSASPGWEDAMA
jgi:hypothetical protein